MWGVAWVAYISAAIFLPIAFFAISFFCYLNWRQIFFAIAFFAILVFYSFF